jgi:hypothetical protein
MASHAQGLNGGEVTIFDAIFGCWHKRTTFPITNRKGERRSDVQRGTYVVCLDCGKEFAYDWQKMRILSPRKEESYAASQVEAKAS